MILSLGDEKLKVYKAHTVWWVHIPRLFGKAAITYQRKGSVYSEDRYVLVKVRCHGAASWQDAIGDALRMLAYRRSHGRAA